MIICVPTHENRGLDSGVYPHFGSAPAFIIHDTDTGETKFLDNNNQHHGDGTCNPAQKLMGETVDVVLTGGMGARAIEMLNAMGIKVYMATAGTVRNNIEALNDQKLEELTVRNACGQHNMHGGCGH
ncbi:MAG: NifB/NifX family molybdenum-iron cluster-binding protein [Syntrophales bacterium]|jgi:predicted Fe-Mo cluster-binding NifX family protein|nr:NifB/NifX family molybdenum-iron cluster-binding protein [Syntrophales bacterium]NLN60542.1 diguanylate cyclase [Deltaproteobacteria bacterium]